MYTEFDEKGKIFTDVVKKQPVDVHIQTSTHLIKGKCYVRLDERIKDELDKTEMFIAVTDASIYDMTGKMIRCCNFLAVNSQHIVWLFQDNESKDPGEDS